MLALRNSLLTKKILFFSHYAGLLGSNRSLLDLIQGSNDKKIKPFVIIPADGVFRNELQNSGIPYNILPFPWWMTTKQKSIKLWRQYHQNIEANEASFDELIRSWEIDLVYSNSSVFSTGMMAAKRHHIPHIWHIREFGDLDYDLQYIPPKILCRHMIRRSDAIVCNSRAVQRHYFGGRAFHKSKVIYNGIAFRSEFDDYYEKRLKSTKIHPYTFSIVGSISSKKGQEAAIRALGAVKKSGVDARLIVVGAGREAYVDSCKQLAVDLGIAEAVTFTGYMEDPYQAYFGADCLLMCSENEAFGRVTAEAMSACLPVIGRKSGGTPEVIVDGDSGILYDQFDDLVAAMIYLSKNPEVGRQMGLAGWARAKEKFNIETYAENVYRVIQSVMK